VPKRISEPRAPRRVLAILALALVAAIPAAALAQSLFKWTDKDGQVHYGDQPPKGFSGPVTRIDVDTKGNTQALPPAAPRAAKESVSEEAPSESNDPAKKRRELRERLAANVKSARAALAAAKAALDDAGPAGDEERQVIRQYFDKPQAGRSNCRPTQNAAGKTVYICPAMVPNDAYYERVKSLEDAVAKAEEELDKAEQAYRRGVD
jgi:uncharacterized protein DUF4124